MIINGVFIDDTYAEAFGMKATRIVITADNLTWARHAANAAFGFATSVIACGCEAAIECELSPADTPDGRPGVAGLLFAVSTKELAKQLERRVGQCVLTCPTTAVFAGCEGEESLPLGKNLRYFGDGWQMSKLIAGRRYWRIPVMDGEFLAEESTGLLRSVGGGNFLVLARSRGQALAACEAAVDAIARVPGAIAPFPGGVVRSGSKVGSKYKALPASTNDAFCPTLRGVAKTELTPDTDAVLEIVIDAVTDADMRVAMKAGMDAVCGIGAAGGIVRLSAGNYGGKLGQFHYRLREILA
ncbi:MAG: formylmethanofuran--tetrahydromethanopterin N-formyltransferase [Thiobacillus sp. 63-78]|uniref:formylmethanofuran--tetrahydromethanopterin N-formyltransferase n=1 Tax=Thiobacillus sp. 63-78 TaxID=1895859 RepID=UPI00095FC97A|nr:formylmethanofuran--tetrahydromethanopterin N-formyltransferase [Thiobacillus sp. 63-78]MBN8763062.1 formylmethanofuran--tetrahydromethanopterin N-formyltransferase [Thiobacillus sp.]MBN8774075.1 formylmethanofuran--tetrahydromethanopterin N-formyltransferase [Thiobacillus sp.]OJZ16917.1 MAG: formylmethanofuran--tetrahydromethanopterin N-formyltransferase [Thiobacillus sp. 63-78]